MKSEREVELICELIATKDEIKDLTEVREMYLNIGMADQYWRRKLFEKLEGKLSKLTTEIGCLESDLVNLVEAWSEL